MLEPSVAKLLRAIRPLVADEEIIDPKKWYLTQKQHWLGWLADYAGPGAYGRKLGPKRDARFAYNHIVEGKMLLWLAEASGVEPRLVRKARREAAKWSTLMQQAGAIRRVLTWDIVAAALWPERVK